MFLCVCQVPHNANLTAWVLTKHLDLMVSLCRVFCLQQLNYFLWQSPLFIWGPLRPLDMYVQLVKPQHWLLQSSTQCPVAKSLSCGCVVAALNPTSAALKQPVIWLPADALFFFLVVCVWWRSVENIMMQKETTQDGFKPLVLKPGWTISADLNNYFSKT